jgi:hypothetical protein
VVIKSSAAAIAYKFHAKAVNTCEYAVLILVSESSFARMVTSVGGDKEFATAIAKRDDLPAELGPWLDAALAGGS